MRRVLASLVACALLASSADAQDRADEALDACFRQCMPQTHGHGPTASIADSPDCAHPTMAWERALCEQEARERDCRGRCYRDIAEPAARARADAARRRADAERAALEAELERARHEMDLAVARATEAEAMRRRHRGETPQATVIQPQCDPVPAGLDECRQLCMQGHSDACDAVAGSYYRTGDADVQEQAERDMLPWVRRGCDNGSAGACAYLVSSVPYSEQNAAYARAVGIAQLGCDNGDPESCTRLGNMQYGGYNYSLRVEFPPIARNLRRGCELGDATACYSLLAYLKNQAAENENRRSIGGFPSDAQALADRMIENAEAACTSDHTRARTRCFPLAEILISDRTHYGSYDIDGIRREHNYLSGETIPALSIPHDPARGFAILDESCQSGYQPACDRAASLRR